MRLLDIRECEVAIEVDLTACRELAVACRRAALQTGPGEDSRRLLWESQACFWEAAAMASSVFSEMEPEYRAKHPCAYHRAKLVPAERKDGRA